MKTVAELEARIKELEDAVEWAIENIIMPVPEFRHELRARAFPPKFEEVEVKRWECKTCGTMFKSQIVNGGNGCCWGVDTLIPLTGQYKRPIPTKVKRREELPQDCVDLTYHHLHNRTGKVFFEWYE